MNTRLNNETITLDKDEVFKDPKAEAIAWLRERKERRAAMESSIKEMTPSQLYRRLDWLAKHRREYGQGHNEGAVYVRDFCKKERERIKRELKRRELPTTRPGDQRVYGSGAASWQRAGGAP